MMPDLQTALVEYLRTLGNDDTGFPECSDQQDSNGCCPDHEDCGVCRYEYMKKEGWIQ